MNGSYHRVSTGTDIGAGSSAAHGRRNSDSDSNSNSGSRVVKNGNRRGAKHIGDLESDPSRGSHIIRGCCWHEEGTSSLTSYVPPWASVSGPWRSQQELKERKSFLSGVYRPSASGQKSKRAIIRRDGILCLFLRCSASEEAKGRSQQIARSWCALTTQPPERPRAQEFRLLSLDSTFLLILRLKVYASKG